MEIIVARHAGFCFGVERAIDIVKDAAKEYNHVVTFGPIIHNPQVVGELKEAGVATIKSLYEVSKDMSVVIRSHGIERTEAEYLAENAGNVVDAACPFVKKAQIAAARLSKSCDYIVILGESDHPEVKGIVSYIDIPYKVIESAEEVDALDYVEKYGFLAQTTQSISIFENAVEKLKHKCSELSIAKTICSATEKRQEAAIEVASKVEVMIVVGGKNSANTTRLYHLCKEICPNTYHVETVAELRVDMFQGISKVGLTAGASTPTYLLEKVREYILEVAR